MPWKLTRHVTEREYRILEGEIPDLQDPCEQKRMVIRPRKVTFYQKPGTNEVTYVCIEGRQVRRDGELAGSKVVLVGHGRGLGTPPDWMDTLMLVAELHWENGETVR